MTTIGTISGEEVRRRRREQAEATDTVSRNPNFYEVSEPEVLRVGVHESVLDSSCGSTMSPPPPALGAQG